MKTKLNPLEQKKQCMFQLTFVTFVCVMTTIFFLSTGFEQAFAKKDKQGGGFLSNATVQQDSAQKPVNKQGFTGPSADPVSVEKAKTMADDERVTLKGHITKSLGGKAYLFSDNSGEIELKISEKTWQGQTISPSDLVEIYGEIDKEKSGSKIKVKQITKK